MTTLQDAPPRPILARHVHIHSGLNRWLAVHITNVVGTMPCAYVFALIALISLPAAIASGQVIVMVAWIAQTFLQLVLLSIIMVGQQVQSAVSDARAIADLDVNQRSFAALQRVEQQIQVSEASILEAVFSRPDPNDLAAMLTRLHQQQRDGS